MSIESLKKRRELFLSQGLCGHCGDKTPPGRKHCEQHLAYYRLRTAERRREARRLKFCIYCMKVPAEKWNYCLPCLDKTRVGNKRYLISRHQRLKASGICVTCTDDDAAPGKVQCTGCYEVQKFKRKVRQENKRL